jgi:Zn-dependent protease with chaperone function
MLNLRGAGGSFLLVLVLLRFWGPGEAWAQTDQAGVKAEPLMFWNTVGMLERKVETLELRGVDGKGGGVIARTRVAQLLAVRARIEKQAGFTVELFLMNGETPNAISIDFEGRNVVAFNLKLLELLSGDADAQAFVMAHELAHLAKKHGAAIREQQRNAQMAASIIAGLFGLRGLPVGQLLGNLAGNAAGLAILTSYSRDQEREADALGLSLLSGAGYAPEAAVRTQRKLMAVEKSRPPAFLNSHPTSEERIDNLQRQIASLPQGDVLPVQRRLDEPLVVPVAAVPDGVASIDVEVAPGSTAVLFAVGVPQAADTQPRSAGIFTPVRCRLPEGGEPMVVPRVECTRRGGAVE